MDSLARMQFILDQISMAERERSGQCHRIRESDQHSPISPDLPGLGDRNQ
jgi:hypothetical protein